MTTEEQIKNLSESLLQVTNTVNSLALSMQQLVDQGGGLQPNAPNANAGAGSSSLKAVPWNLIKTLCPDKLNVDTMSVKQQKAWHRKFLAFSKESKLDQRDWATQKTALETMMSPTTFTKIDAMRMQLPKDSTGASQEENLIVILKMTEDLIDGEQSKWAKRHEFHHLKQKADQTARSFYTECVEVSTECEFQESFCDQCKKNVTDQHVLMKVVFNNSSEDARRKMLKTKDLDLEKARKILEDDEILKSTEKTLDEEEAKDNSEVGLIQKKHQRGRQGRSSSRHGHGGARKKTFQTFHPQQECMKCGFEKHGPNQKCPAEGAECHNCGKMNHYSRVCMGPGDRSRKPFKSGSGPPYKHGRGIICQIRSRITTVPVQLTALKSVKISAVMDTGSDWSCVPADKVNLLGETIHNLYPATEEMQSTLNANGQKMVVEGYVKADVSFGTKQIKNVKFVVFDGVKDVILSKDAMLDLGIITFHLEPEASTSKESKTEEKTPKVSSAKVKPPIAKKPPVPDYSKAKTAKKSQESLTREKILEEYHDLFEPRTSPMKGEKYEIVLEPDAVPCRVHHARNVPIPLQEKLKKEVEALEKAGYISKVTKATDWCSPIVVAPKKDSEEIRLCVDFRDLNRYSKREFFDSPSVLETVQLINEKDAKLFSKFDAKKGYHQIELSESSKDLTCFMTPFGRYRYERAPFGVNSIPEHFNRKMSEALEGVPNVARIVDDCLVYGKDEKEHDENVGRFLDRCRERNIHLNPAKFEFKKKEVIFGGMNVYDGGFEIEEKAVEAITKFPEPTSLNEMQKFHGYLNQMSPFDPDIAKKFEPLRHLMKKSSTEFKMTEDEKAAFSEVKRQLAKPKALAYFTPGRPVQVFTDACSYGYGFVMKQLQRDNKTWKPVQFGSRTLTDSETRYCPIEAEMNALAWALKKLKKFVLGGPRFTVYTDHKPLVTVVNKRRLDEVQNNRLLRCLLNCQAFSFEVEYLPGKENVISDALSRAPVSRPDTDDVKRSELTSYQIRAIQNACIEEAELPAPLKRIKMEAATDFEYRALMKTILEGFPSSKNQLDPAVQSYWNVRDELSISDDDFVLRGVRLVIPRKLRKSVMEELHSSHRGIELTKSRARLVVYWPSIDAHLENLCKSCSLCEPHVPSQRAEPKIHLPIPSRIFQYMSADFADINGGKFLIVTDWKSGWFHAKQMRKTDGSATIHQLRTIFMDTAVPEILYSDNGPPFSSKEFKDFLSRWGVKWVSSSPYYPKSNSIAENGVKSAKSLLKKCVKNGKIDQELWAKGLLTIRNTPTKGTQLSPAMQLFGHSVRDTTPAHKSALSKDWHKEVADYDRKVSHERQRIAKYEKGRALPLLKIGDPVLIQNRVTKKWDKFGVIQERNLRVRKYTIRLPSGLIVTRNRIQIRKRTPRSESHSGGTNMWNPFPQSPSNEPENSETSRDYESDSSDSSDGDEEDNVGGGFVGRNETVVPPVQVQTRRPRRRPESDLGPIIQGPRDRKKTVRFNNGT